MKNSTLLLTLFAFVVSTTLSALTPAYLKIKVYGVYVSTSELCTNLKLLHSNDAPEYEDVLAGPTFANIDNKTGAWDGTYKCVVLKMGDRIKYTPTASGGACVKDTEYTLDVCGNGGQNSVDENSATVTCSANTEDIPYLYLSTSSTTTNGGNGNAWIPPTNSNATNGFKLNAAFVIAGAKTGTFVVDGTDKITTSNNQCEMNPPSFSFR